MHKLSLVCIGILYAVTSHAVSIQPAGLKDVTITGGFWLPRVETNRTVTLWTDFKKCEETGRIANFERAGKRIRGKFQGIPFDDSDVFKVIEGAAEILATHPDPKLDKYLDDLIAKIAAAQEPDGYLYTARTQGYIIPMTGPTRWSSLGGSHELYNVGHLYEAAVAHFFATGKRTLLDVAIKSADLIDRTFGMGKTQLKIVPGHEEIEIGLCKLYTATKEPRYLRLAKTFIDLRGQKNLRPLFGENVQDHKPVLEQTEAVGHAVRAGYLYAGMADVTALANDPTYHPILQTLWKNVVSQKLHLSGGIGAHREGERFGKNYDLPNETAYLETCAAIANALWNQRMFLIEGDGKYIDVLERILYNGFLSGISLGGDEFFYPNPLASTGGYRRSKWFGCSCCPVNIVRFIPQISTFTYATSADRLYWKLFNTSESTLSLNGQKIHLSQQTEYPWAGDATLTVKTETENTPFTLLVRIPGWAVGEPVPSDLYRQLLPASIAQIKLLVNGQPFPVKREKGFCAIQRTWKSGDRVTLSLDLSVRRIQAHPAVQANQNRLAVERGPVLFCAETADNPDGVLNQTLAPDATFSMTAVTIQGATFPALSVRSSRVLGGLRERTEAPSQLKLIPYFAWCHRGAGEMQTWFPTDRKGVTIKPSYKISVSHCNDSDTPNAMCDIRIPSNSNDHAIPRMTFWGRKGSSEWVQYTLPKAEKICGTEVYWFDDTPKGGCGLPANWKVQYREDENGAWKDATAKSSDVRKDVFNKLTFEKPITAKEIRISIQLRPHLSAGILEWKLF